MQRTNPLLNLVKSRGVDTFTNEELDRRFFDDPIHQPQIQQRAATRHYAKPPPSPPPPQQHYQQSYIGVGPDDSGTETDESWPELDVKSQKPAKKGRHHHSSSPSPNTTNMLLGILAAVLVAALVGIVIYLVVNSIHSGDESSAGSSAEVVSVQEVEKLVEVSPLAQYHKAENSQLEAQYSISSLSYAFTVGSQLQIKERHPTTGSLLSIPYDNLRFYTVCCSVQSKNFVCLGGVSYATPGLQFEASLEYDQETKDIYLALWVNGKDLLGAGCYAHISYVPP